MLAETYQKTHAYTFLRIINANPSLNSIKTDFAANSLLISRNYQCTWIWIILK